MLQFSKEVENFEVNEYWGGKQSRIKKIAHSLRVKRLP